MQMQYLAFHLIGAAMSIFTADMPETQVHAVAKLGNQHQMCARLKATDSVVEYAAQRTRSNTNNKVVSV